LYNELRSDPLFDSTFEQLADLRDVTGVALTHEAIFALAAEPLYEPLMRRAVVVTSPTHYGVVRIFAAYAMMRGPYVNVFWDVESAERWLGL
jgi:hypothetical protein